MKKGFTLIELMVVISIFALIILIATDLFLFIIQQQKRTLNQQELLNQTSYIIEYMGRALRMAKKDTNGSCLGTADMSYGLTYNDDDVVNGVKLINHSNNDICQKFFLDSDGLLKESKDDSDPLPLISSKLQVNYFKIKLFGESDSDDLQPRVTLSLEIQVKGGGEQPKKQIQTTISQRNLDE